MPKRFGGSKNFAVPCKTAKFIYLIINTSKFYPVGTCVGTDFAIRENLNPQNFLAVQYHQEYITVKACNSLPYKGELARSDAVIYVFTHIVNVVTHCIRWQCILSTMYYDTCV